MTRIRAKAATVASAAVLASGLTVATVPAQAYVGPSTGVERSLLTFDEFCSRSGVPDCAADFTQTPQPASGVHPGGAVQWLGIHFFDSTARGIHADTAITPYSSAEFAAYHFGYQRQDVGGTVVESTDTSVLFTTERQYPESGTAWGYGAITLAGDAIVRATCWANPDWIQPPPDVMDLLATCARNTAAAQATKWREVSPEFATDLTAPTPTIKALDTQLRIEWTPVSEPPEYVGSWTLEWSGPDGEFPPNGLHYPARELTVGLTQDHYTTKPLPPGTYRARLVANTPWGPGPLGQPTAPVILLDVTPPDQEPWVGTPTFTSPRRGVLVARLSVTNGAASTFYQYRVKQIGKSKATPWTKTTASKVRLIGLKPGATYRFSVRAVGPAGVGPTGTFTTPRIHR